MTFDLSYVYPFKKSSTMYLKELVMVIDLLLYLKTELFYLNSKKRLRQNILSQFIWFAAFILINSSNTLHS